MGLKVEDLKVGDKYKLIMPALEGYVLNAVYEIEEIDGDHVGFKSVNDFLYFENLVYFKKVEQSQQYTFDDLIDIAVKAWKDRVINGFTVVDEKLNCQTLDGEDYNLGIGCEVAHGIEYLQSLYKETFVIECEEDMKRIKDTAQITMSNKEILDYKDAISLEHYTNSFILKLLKGATVTQSK